MIAETVTGGVIMATAGATILAVLTTAILNGQGIAIAGLVIGFAAPAIWDRWRCRRWPQPTELPPPRVHGVVLQQARPADLDSPIFSRLLPTDLPLSNALEPGPP